MDTVTPDKIDTLINQTLGFADASMEDINGQETPLRKAAGRLRDEFSTSGITKKQFGQLLAECGVAE